MNLSNYTKKDLLLSAIKSEVESNRIYTLLAEIVENGLMKDKFIYLAREEQKHKHFLESIFKNGIYEAKTGDTDIFIYPGYEIKSFQGLITNFHLPKSTLLLMIAAFAGHNLIKKAYQQAINEKYRFYSFGDAMLILADRYNDTMSS